MFSINHEALQSTRIDAGLPIPEAAAIELKKSVGKTGLKKQMKAGWRKNNALKFMQSPVLLINGAADHFPALNSCYVIDQLIHIHTVFV